MEKSIGIIDLALMKYH